MAITFCSNQAKGRWVATVLTSVGALRVSIGPPIMVSVFGRQGFLSALISAAAAIGRHRGLADREHVRAGPDMLEELDQIVDIIVEVEAAVVERAPASRRASR